MKLEVEQLKNIVKGVNIFYAVFGAVAFILGCVYLSKFTSEIGDIMENNTPDQAKIIALVDLSTGVKFVFGVFAIALGLAVICFAILAIVGIRKNNLFVLKFVAALLVISAVILIIITGIGFRHTSNTDAYKNEFRTVLPELEIHIKYLEEKYDCSISSRYSRRNCADVIVDDSTPTYVLGSSFALIGCLLDIMMATLTIFLVRAINNSKRRGQYQG